MNVTELKAAISSYTENQFSDTDLTTFITQAEQRILNSVQLPASRITVQLSAPAGAQFIALPVGFLTMHSLSVTLATGEVRYLLNKDVNFIREAFPYPQVQGAPTHYALFSDDELLVGPTPDAPYSMTLAYFGYPESITTSANGRSWLGDNFSSVLLYGALMEASTFMKGEQDMNALYDGKFKEALALLKQLADAKNRQDSYRAGQVRYPVT